jgi:hypothetical protein
LIASTCAVNVWTGMAGDSNRMLKRSASVRLVALVCLVDLVHLSGLSG